VPKRKLKFRTPGFYSSANPKEVNRALKQIEKLEGRLTGELIVKHAAPEEHPLHPYFEWDDSIAAHKYRVEQAQRLLLNLQIVVEEEDEIIVLGPKYVRVVDEEGSKYIETESADVKDEDFIMANAIRDLMGWVKRYESLAGMMPSVFADVHKAIRAAKKDRAA